ncbi:MAG: GLUG motif-containing protein, partial [Planctomycetota bacterium]
MSIGSNSALLDKSFKLTNGIVFDPDSNPAHVFTDALIAPYSTYAAPEDGPAFTGHFDGNNHQIVNLKIEGGDYNIGLFGGLIGTNSDEVLVRDLTFVNPIISGQRRSGAMAGRTYNCKVVNCHVIGGLVSHADGYFMGGLVGGSFYSVLDQCTSSAQVSGNGAIGGLAGTLNSASLTNCSASGDVTGTGNEVGGLVGSAKRWTQVPELIDSEEIVNCYATGNVHSDSSYGGGLIGRISAGTVQNCYATGTVSGDSSLGGLIGLIDYVDLHSS